MIVQGRDYEHTLEFDRVGASAGVSYQPGDAVKIGRHVLSGAAFDAAEFSLSAIMILADRGKLKVVPIPVFPARAFFHSYLFVRANSPLSSVAELPGLRIGLRDYASTAAVWFRGLLGDLGIDWHGIEWHTGPNARFEAPPHARVVAASGDLEQMLLNGQIYLFFSARVQDANQNPEDRCIRLLLADTQGAEVAYARELQLHPIMHAVVLSADCIKEKPDAPQLIFAAYQAAKEVALQRRLGASFMPWADAAWARALDALGPNPLPYGLSAENRHTIATLGRYLAEQGLIGAPPDIDALFWHGPP